MGPRITVVNDNPEFLELIRDILADVRYPTTCIDGDDPYAFARVLESRPDLLIIDFRLGAGDHGWEIAQQVRREPRLEGLPVIVCSADVVALQELAGDLAETKWVRALPKPFHVDELTAMIDSLLAEAAAG